MNNELEMSFIELIDIDDIVEGTYENVYDITVEEDESFALANGIISHNSAVSGIVEARDPKLHGCLPLRGKVLNVNGVSRLDIINNDALSKIMAAVGLVPNQKVTSRRQLRYGKIYITTDADEDGKNISALLVNFFYTCWPELFDQKDPFIYLYHTPYIIAGKGKQKKYWYNEEQHKFDPEEHKGWEITRAKGLAGLRREDWKWVLANERTFPIYDDGKLEETLDLLFNKDKADDRKDWIGMHGG